VHAVIENIHHKNKVL